MKKKDYYPDLYCMDCGKKIGKKRTGQLHNVTMFRDKMVKATGHLNLIICDKCGEKMFSALSKTPFNRKYGIWLSTPHPDKKQERWDTVFEISRGHSA